MLDSDILALRVYCANNKRKHLGNQETSSPGFCKLADLRVYEMITLTLLSRETQELDSQLLINPNIIKNRTRYHT